MNLLDMRTVVVSYSISSLLCTTVIATLWLQYRRRSTGLNLWLAGFIVQFIGLLLAGIFRDNLPEFFSIFLSTVLILGGFLFFLSGLERYTGTSSHLAAPLIYLGVYILVQLVFLYQHPDSQVRDFNFSLGLLFLSSLCSWLLLHRVDPALRRDTQLLGLVFGTFSLVSLVRISVDLRIQPGINFFDSNGYDTLLLLIFQMLYISLAFTFFLMVNNRLRSDLEKDVTQRKNTEAALKISEEKVAIVFQNIPDAIVVTTLADGKIIEANPSFFRLTEYSQEECMGQTTIELGMWVDLTARNEVIQTLQKHNRLLAYEAEFCKKSGEVFKASISCELFQLQDQACVLTVIHDITHRKAAELELQFKNVILSTVQEASLDGILVVDEESKIIFYNQRFVEMWGIPPELVVSKDDPPVLEFVTSQVTNSKKFLQQVQYLYLHKQETSRDEIVLKNGKVFDRYSAPMIGSESRFFGRVWYFLDISDRKHSEVIQNAIYRISQTVIISKGIDDLYRSIHEILGQLIPAENFFIALNDPVNETVHFPYFVDQYDPPPAGSVSINGLTGYVIRTGRSLLATREELENLIREGKVALSGRLGEDWLGVPLQLGGRIIGVMAVQSYTPEIHYNRNDVELLEFISTQVAQAIERLRLEEEIRSLSLTDELTGLYNRRGFILLAEQEMKLARRAKRKMMLFFGDVDNLKRINDTLGHLQGDQVLKEISAILRICFREMDILGRIGGDEFVVLAPDASLDSADCVINRINAALEEHNRLDSTAYLLSFSLGVACFDPEAPKSINEMIAQADKMMYEKKQAKKSF